VANSAPALPRETLRDRSKLASALLLRRLIVRLFGMRTLGHFLSRKLFPRPAQAALRRAFVARWAENQPDAYLASAATVSGWSVEDHLYLITCPVCVIAGEHDFIPLKVKQRYTDRLPNGGLIPIPASGHLTPVDSPDEFNRAVLSFLARQGCAIDSRRRDG
jgi:3-oxoadipate enol-lactonase